MKCKYLLIGLLISTVFSSSITLIYPNGGEDLIGGETIDITWSTEGDIPYVDISFSDDGGYTWEVITEESENLGFYQWDIPIYEESMLDTCLIKVYDNSDGVPYDISSEFSISSPCPDPYEPNNDNDATYDILFDNSYSGCTYYNQSSSYDYDYYQFNTADAYAVNLEIALDTPNMNEDNSTNCGYSLSFSIHPSTSYGTLYSGSIVETAGDDSEVQIVAFLEQYSDYDLKIYGYDYCYNEDTGVASYNPLAYTFSLSYDVFSCEDSYEDNNDSSSAFSCFEYTTGDCNSYENGDCISYENGDCIDYASCFSINNSSDCNDAGCTWYDDYWTGNGSSCEGGTVCIEYEQVCSDYQQVCSEYEQICVDTIHNTILSGCIDVLSDSDYFEFYADNGDIITIDIQPDGSTTDLENFHAELYSSQGVLLQQDISDSSIDMAITYITQESGDYILKLYSMGNPGEYSFVINSNNPNFQNTILGCNDDSACNYYSFSNTNDGSCEYPQEYYNCYGECIASLDCLGNCGGNATVDECGICGGEDFNGNEECDVVCEGEEVADCEGVCGGQSTLDCEGVCGGSAVVDECGVCNGSGIPEDECDCEGNVYDICGDCGGDAIDVISCGDGEEESLNVNNNLPNTLEISAAYPNPFNPVTTISYSVPEYSRINLEVFSSNGRKVDVIKSALHSPGLYSEVWDASDFSNGIYFIRLTDNNNVHIQKVLLMK